VLFTDRDIKLHFSFERFLETRSARPLAQSTPIWFKVRRGMQRKKMA